MIPNVPEYNNIFDENKKSYLSNKVKTKIPKTYKQIERRSRKIVI